MHLRAMAKINLGLDVLGRREDGYHEVRMIMQTVKLYDRLELEAADRPGITLQTNLNFLPTDGSNLAFRAAELLMKEFQISSGLNIKLEKHIPVAAGLAGGSSDAAAVLVGVNRLFDLGLSREELMARGAKLGADVPYCIMRGTVLAEGIGEKLTALPPAPKCFCLIAKPPVSVSTKYVYTHLDAEEIIDHPDIDAQLEALRKGDLVSLAAHMGNVLETVTIPAHPVIADIKKEMTDAGAIGAMMSGSGPTVFGLFASKEKAESAKKRIQDKKMAGSVYVTTFFRTGGKADE